MRADDKGTIGYQFGEYRGLMLKISIAGYQVWIMWGLYLESARHPDRAVPEMKTTLNASDVLCLDVSKSWRLPVESN